MMGQWQAGSRFDPHFFILHTFDALVKSKPLWASLSFFSKRMVLHTCNPSTHKLKQMSESEAILGCIVSTYLKQNKSIKVNNHSCQWDCLSPFIGPLTDSFKRQFTISSVIKKIPHHPYTSQPGAGFQHNSYMLEAGYPRLHWVTGVPCRSTQQARVCRKCCPVHYPQRWLRDRDSGKRPCVILMYVIIRVSKNR